MAQQDSRILVVHRYDKEEERYVDDWLKEQTFDLNTKPGRRAAALALLNACVNSSIQVRLAHWNDSDAERTFSSKDLF